MWIFCDQNQSLKTSRGPHDLQRTEARLRTGENPKEVKVLHGAPRGWVLHGKDKVRQIGSEFPTAGDFCLENPAPVYSCRKSVSDNQPVVGPEDGSHG